MLRMQWVTAAGVATTGRGTGKPMVGALSHTNSAAAREPLPK
jgi:hypothetical protein